MTYYSTSRGKSGALWNINFLSVSFNRLDANDAIWYFCYIDVLNMLKSCNCYIWNHIILSNIMQTYKSRQICVDPTSRILFTDCWCQLVPTHATKTFWNLDGRHSCGELEISWCSGQLSWALAFATSLSVAAFLRRAGGSMLARTGSHGSGVGRRVPEMRCIVEFNCALTSPVWAERHHTGAQYSHAE